MIIYAVNADKAARILSTRRFLRNINMMILPLRLAQEPYGGIRTAWDLLFQIKRSGKSDYEI